MEVKRYSPYAFIHDGNPTAIMREGEGLYIYISDYDKLAWKNKVLMGLLEKLRRVPSKIIYTHHSYDEKIYAVNLSVINDLICDVDKALKEG
jgi:hypothetical protein